MKKAILHGLEIPETSKLHAENILMRLQKEGIEYAVTEDFFNRNPQFLGGETILGGSEEHTSLLQHIPQPIE